MGLNTMGHIGFEAPPYSKAYNLLHSHNQKNE
jgi:hypothetical protein